ncbi:MAG: tetratricopeptide repeat protein, partial [Rhodospirillales bacterium]|nr:tetratricopeptide repeat protein [Rhodospirillales bacterium]
MTCKRQSMVLRTAGILMMSIWLVLGSVMSASAQDVQGLIDRIDRLERDIRALNIHIAKGSTGTPPELSSGQSDATSGAGSTISTPSVARIDARIAALENDVRVATGSMEELDHRIFQISTQLEKLVSDIDYRLSALEQGGAGSSMNVSGINSGATTSDEMQMNTAPAVGDVTTVMSQTTSGVLGTISETQLQEISDQAATVQNQESVSETIVQSENTLSAVPQVVESAQEPVTTQSAALTAGTAQEEYTHAFGLMRQAKYEDAALALTAFVDKFGDDPLVVNARYWLGETYYVRSQFVKAAEVFFQGY